MHTRFSVLSSLALRSELEKIRGVYFAPKCWKVNKNEIFSSSTSINLISGLVPTIVSGEVAILQIPEDGIRGWTLVLNLISFPNLRGASQDR